MGIDNVTVIGDSTECVETTYQINGTTYHEVFKGQVDSIQITPYGVGVVKFSTPAPDRKGRHISAVVVRNCERILRYRE